MSPAPKESRDPMMSVQVTARLLERVKNAVHYRSGPPPQGRSLTLRAAVEEALLAWVKLEELGSSPNGREFPPRDGTLRTGPRA